MGTWITHLRIAERVMKKFKIRESEFLLGNIGPDSGVMNDDRNSYTPTKEVSHFLTRGEKLQFDYEDFFQKYLDGYTGSKEIYYYRWGYYTHLMTDQFWSNFHYQKKVENPEYAKKFNDDPSFIWEVKQDWYGLDFQYLNSHQSSIFYREFLIEKEVIDYLPFFPKGAFQKQFHYIKDFYLTKSEHFSPTNRYLTIEEVESFVVECSEKIVERMIEKGFGNA